MTHSGCRGFDGMRDGIGRVDHRRVASLIIEFRCDAVCGRDTVGDVADAPLTKIGDHRVKEAARALQPDLIWYNVTDVAAMHLRQADNQRCLRVDEAADDTLNRPMNSPAARIGSSPRCGIAACAPVPAKRSSKLSTAAIIGPTRAAMVLPAGLANCGSHTPPPSGSDPAGHHRSSACCRLHSPRRAGKRNGEPRRSPAARSEA